MRIKSRIVVSILSHEISSSWLYFGHTSLQTPVVLESGSGNLLVFFILKIFKDTPGVSIYLKSSQKQ